MMKKIKIYIFLASILSTVVFFFLWCNTVEKLENTEKALSTEQKLNKTLKEDNNKLVKYTVEKDNEIKRIKAQYEEKLLNIPNDVCGDVKPSNELLIFLRKNKNERVL